LRPGVPTEPQREAKIRAVTALLEEGQELRVECAWELETKSAEENAAFIEKVDRWLYKCSSYLRQNMGADYAARFRNENPPTIQRFFFSKRVDLPALDARIEHLITLLEELRQHP
jgi:hypothetical protein